MSELTGLISPYQLLITAACTNTGGKMKGSHSRAADRCPFVHRHSLSQVTSFMQLGMLCQSTEALCSVKNEDVVEAAPTGDAPTTSELSTISMPIKVPLMIEVRQYFIHSMCLTGRTVKIMQSKIDQFQRCRRSSWPVANERWIMTHTLLAKRLLHPH